MVMLPCRDLIVFLQETELDSLMKISFCFFFSSRGEMGKGRAGEGGVIVHF